MTNPSTAYLWRERQNDVKIIQVKTPAVTDAPTIEGCFYLLPGPQRVKHQSTCENNQGRMNGLRVKGEEGSGWADHINSATFLCAALYREWPFLPLPRIPNKDLWLTMQENGEAAEFYILNAFTLWVDALNQIKYGGYLMHHNWYFQQSHDSIFLISEVCVACMHSYLFFFWKM